MALTYILPLIEEVGNATWAWLRLIVVLYWGCLLQIITKVEYSKVKRYKVSILKQFLNELTKLLDESF